MLVKFLMVNPHHPLFNPGNKDQQMIISGDKEALEAMASALLEAVDAGPGGTEVAVRDMTEGQEITYRFLRMPDEVLRVSRADTN